MKHRLVVLLCIACGCNSTASTATGAGSGSAGSSAPDLACSDAARKFTTVMAASPGELADLAPDPAMMQFIKLTIEQACNAGWTPETRTCVAAAAAASALPACWSDPAGYPAAQAVLHRVVEDITAKRGPTGSAVPGSGSGSVAP